MNYLTEAVFTYSFMIYGEREAITSSCPKKKEARGKTKGGEKRNKKIRRKEARNDKSCLEERLALVHALGALVVILIVLPRYITARYARYV